MSNQKTYNLLEFTLFPPTWFNETKLKHRLQDKTVLITGASFGIGESLSLKLAHSGAHLILVARTEEKLIELKNKIENAGGKASVFAVDLTNTEAVKIFLEKLHHIPGGIDLFINNAGKSIRRSIKNSLERNHDFTRTMALNYFAPVQIMLSIIPLLEKNKGHVINISAVNVLLIPASRWAAYQASKAAFDQWFRSAAPELNAYGIKTTSIYLPLVRTRMIEPTEAYKNVPAMKPEHVAKIICRAINFRKRKFAPWWLIFGQFASILFRYPWEVLNAYFFKKQK